MREDSRRFFGEEATVGITAGFVVLLALGILGALGFYAFKHGSRARNTAQVPEEHCERVDCLPEEEILSVPEPGVAPITPFRMREVQASQALARAAMSQIP